MKTEIFDIMLVLFLPILIVFIIYVRSMSQSKNHKHPIPPDPGPAPKIWGWESNESEALIKKKAYFIIMGAEKAGLTHAQEIQIRKHLENMYKKNNGSCI